MIVHEIAQAKRPDGTLVQHWRPDFKHGTEDMKLIVSPAHKAYLDMKYDRSTPIGLEWAARIEVRDSYDWDPVTLAGVSDRKLPYRWAKPDGPIPGDSALQRLQTAHRIWHVLSTNEPDQVVRAWFIGANPLLDETPPVMALREGDLRGTAKAAESFIDGTWHG